MNAFIITPKGSSKTDAQLVWNVGMAAKWNGRFKNAQVFIDSEILRLCDPYTPFRVGMLIKSGQLGTVFGSGLVSWIVPYAKYQYYGEVMAGKPRRPTAKNLVYHSGGLRGSFWFPRMWAVNDNTIVAGANRIVGGGA